MTKQELEEQVAELKVNLNNLKTNEEILRKEFATAFNWVKERNTYSSETVYQTPSWKQIFVEIGKMLEVKNKMITLGQVDKNTYDIEQMRRTLLDMIEDK